MTMPPWARKSFYKRVEEEELEPPADLDAQLAGLEGLNWIGKLGGMTLTKPFRPPQVEPTWRPPTEEEKKSGLYAYQYTGADVKAYEEWDDPGFTVDLPEWMHWLPTEEKGEAKFGVKGIAEEFVYLPFWLAGAGGISKQQQLFKISEKLGARKAAGKVLTKPQEVVLQQAKELESQLIHRSKTELMLEANRLASQSGLSKKQLNKLAKDTVGKIHTRDMAEGEIQTVINSLKTQRQILLPSERDMGLNAARKQNDYLARELAESMGVVLKEPAIVTKETLKVGKVARVKEVANDFLARGYRVERILDKVDGHVKAYKYNITGGKVTQAIWNKVNQATDDVIRVREEGYKGLRDTMDYLKADLGKMLNEPAKEVYPGVKLTSFERIGLYMHSMNPDNLRHVALGNLEKVTLEKGRGFTSQLIRKVGESLSPQERVIGDWMMGWFSSQSPANANAMLMATGKKLNVVTNYFRILLRGGEISFDEAMATESIMRSGKKWASQYVTKGFTKARTPKANQPIELDALNIFMRSVDEFPHYQKFAPLIRDLQRIINNPAFKRTFQERAGEGEYKVLEKWLGDVAKTDPLGVGNAAEKWGRFFRTNATTAVLGFNLITALKQFPSFVTGMAVTGEIPALKGLFNYVSNPKETSRLIQRLSPQIWKRSFEREIAEMRQMRSAGKRLQGKLSTKEVFMLLTTTMDKTAVSSLWRGAFDDAVKRGMSETKAAAYGEKVIRQTQPFFGIKDVPEFWRSGELARALTMFTNQLNQYWNFFKFDTFGAAKAGTISRVEVGRRILEGFVIPSMMIGAISRSRLPESAGEIFRDLGSMAAATIPIFGTAVSSAIRGYFDYQGLITTQFMEELQKTIYYANKGAWDKMLKTAPLAVGVATGIPTVQPQRIIQALIDLAEGNSNDLLDLIWGRYTRQKATGGQGGAAIGEPVSKASDILRRTSGQRTGGTTSKSSDILNRTRRK